MRLWVVGLFFCLAVLPFISSESVEESFESDSDYFEYNNDDDLEDGLFKRKCNKPGCGVFRRKKLYPHQDAHKYWQCIKKGLFKYRAIEVECEEAGHVFDYKKQHCVDPTQESWKSVCRSWSTTTSSTSTTEATTTTEEVTTEEPTTTPEVTTEISTTTLRPLPVPQDCDSVPKCDSSEVLFPTRDPTQFYECVIIATESGISYQAIQNDCPVAINGNKQYFSFLHQACVDALFWSDVCIPDVSSCTIPTCFDQKKKFPDRNPRDYYECVTDENGHLYAKRQTCDTSKLFGNKQQKCVKPSKWKDACK